MTCILTGLLWVPYMLDRIKVRGLMGTMANPSPKDTPQAPWAQRLYFAHTNAVDNLVVFAPLVLILDTLGRSTNATVLACARSISGRVWPTPSSMRFGLPVFRTLAFLVGFCRAGRAGGVRCLRMI